jgi:hypothetical protein
MMSVKSQTLCAHCYVRCPKDTFGRCTHCGAKNSYDRSVSPLNAPVSFLGGLQDKPG